MFLTGTYPRAIDDKLRLALPKKLRDGLGGAETALYLAPGTDGSLSLFNETEFGKLAERLQNGSPHGKDVRDFSRLFFAQAQAVETDAQGRMRVPSELARLAGLEGEVVVVGVRDHVEIWNRLRWDAYLSSLQPAYDQIAERVFEPTSQSKKEEVAAPREDAVIGKPR
jgi:MraZ protein